MAENKGVVSGLSVKELLGYLDILKGKNISGDQLIEYLYQLNAAIKLEIAKDLIIKAVKESLDADDLAGKIKQLADKDKYYQMYNESRQLKKNRKPFIKRNAGNVEAGNAFFNNAMGAGNGQALGEAVLNSRPESLEKLMSVVSVNSPAYRGAPQPKAKALAINESNFADNMRFKWWDIRVLDDNTVFLDWVTQEPFTKEDYNSLSYELLRAFTEIASYYGYDREFKVKVRVTARDGKSYGFIEDEFYVEV